MAVETDKRLIWRCLTCGATQPFKGTGTGYGKLIKHRCTGKRVLRLIDKDTGEELASNVTSARAKGLIAKKPPKAQIQERKPSIGVNGDEHIKEHYQGYSKDGESFLFVMHPDGRVRDLRLEYPLLYPIFQLMRDKQGYKGDFPQFVSDAVETLFANAGFELALVPKSQSIIYEQAIKLLNEGKLELVNQEDTVALEVKNGHQDESARGQALFKAEHQPGGEAAGQEPGEEEPGQPQ